MNTSHQPSAISYQLQDAAAFPRELVLRNPVRGVCPVCHDFVAVFEADDRVWKGNVSLCPTCADRHDLRTLIRLLPPMEHIAAQEVHRAAQAQMMRVLMAMQLQGAWQKGGVR